MTALSWPPRREPCPAATRMAATRGSRLLLPLTPVLDLGEDHPAHGGLEDPGDDNAPLGVEEALSPLHYHHGAIIHEAHPLAQLLPLLDDADVHLFPRQEHGPY